MRSAQHEQPPGASHRHVEKAQLLVFLLDLGGGLDRVPAVELSFDTVLISDSQAESDRRVLIRVLRVAR